MCEGDSNSQSETLSESWHCGEFRCEPFTLLHNVVYADSTSCLDSCECTRTHLHTGPGKKDTLSNNSFFFILAPFETALGHFDPRQLGFLFPQMGKRRGGGRGGGRGGDDDGGGGRSRGIQGEDQYGETFK